MWFQIVVLFYTVHRHTHHSFNPCCALFTGSRELTVGYTFQLALFQNTMLPWKKKGKANTHDFSL